jgi:hypothetical protein
MIAVFHFMAVKIKTANKKQLGGFLCQAPFVRVSFSGTPRSILQWVTINGAFVVYAYSRLDTFSAAMCDNTIKII